MAVGLRHGFPLFPPLYNKSPRSIISELCPRTFCIVGESCSPGETRRRFSIFSILWAGERLMGGAPHLRRGRRDETGLLS